MFVFSMSGGSFSFSPDLSSTPSPSESPSPSFSNKRSFDNAFYPSAPSAFEGPPPMSSYQPGWMNNRSGYSNNYRGRDDANSSGFNRFPKRS